MSKLFEAQYGKNEEKENLEKKIEANKKLLEISETERSNLQREVAKLQTENSVCFFKSLSYSLIIFKLNPLTDFIFQILFKITSFFYL